MTVLLFKPREFRMEKGLKKTEFVSELKSIVEAATRKLEDEAREN